MTIGQRISERLRGSYRPHHDCDCWSERITGRTLADTIDRAVNRERDGKGVMSWCAHCSHNKTLHGARGCGLCACYGFARSERLLIGQNAAHGLLRAARAALPHLTHDALTHALLAGAIAQAEKR